MMTRCADAELEERIRRSEGRDEGRRESTAQIEKLTAEVTRLREALERIADDGATDSADEFEYIERMRDIARAALGRTP